jgi:hypothetical protein
MIPTGKTLVLFSVERLICTFSLFTSVSPRKFFFTLWNDAINTSFASFPILHLQLYISSYAVQKTSTNRFRNNADLKIELNDTQYIFTC